MPHVSDDARRTLVYLLNIFAPAHVSSVLDSRLPGRNSRGHSESGYLLNIGDVAFPCSCTVSNPVSVNPTQICKCHIKATIPVQNGAGILIAIGPPTLQSSVSSSSSPSPAPRGVNPGSAFHHGKPPLLLLCVRCAQRDVTISDIVLSKSRFHCCEQRLRGYKRT